MSIPNVYKKGTFGKKLLYWQLLPAQKDTSVYFVFFHGTYGTSFKRKYQLLAEKITNANLGNVFLFETSRHVYTFEDAYTQYSREAYEETFAGKTFQDELADVKAIFTHLTTLAPQNATYHFIGSSLGGTLCSFLSNDEHVASLLLLGSGVSTKRPHAPVLKGYPPKQTILDNFDKFKGKLSLIQGTLDTVVPLQEAREIILTPTHPIRKELTIIKGLDHSFGLMDGKKDDTLLTQIVFPKLETLCK